MIIAVKGHAVDSHKENERYNANIRNMLFGMLDDIKFLINIDDVNEYIIMDKKALDSFKKARSCLYDLASQHRAKYPELAEKTPLTSGKMYLRIRCK